MFAFIEGALVIMAVLPVVIILAAMIASIIDTTRNN